MTYAESVAALEEALRFGIDPSLEGIRSLTEALGRPQDSLRCIQVTGTNGKSSVTRLAAALLASQGLRTGAYTSPHLESYTERFEVAGEPVSEADFARGVEAALRAAAEVGGEHTEFELLTAAALWLFRDLGVEWACLEVGMGGRWDATSVVSPAVAVVTGVGLDHTERLGRTVHEIAADKAHVIKAGSIAVLGPGTAEVARVLRDRADGVAAPVVTVGAEDADVTYQVTAAPDRPGGALALSVEGCLGTYPRLELTAPSYQAPNVATALAAVEAALGRAPAIGTVRAALAAMRFPGRFEFVRGGPPAVLDGAHNPQAAAVLAGAIREAFPAARPTLVLGVLADKDAEGIVAALAEVAGAVVVAPPASPRALPAESLAAVVESVTGRRPEKARDIAEALAVAEAYGEALVVTGSLYSVGEARGILLGGSL
ncbi:MAG TPA: Mur ligase family protein [Coriobacteriia bacterium]|jgi:dihydrofolate synthase/folylpolyglutamate synthase